MKRNYRFLYTVLLTIVVFFLVVGPLHYSKSEPIRTFTYALCEKNTCQDYLIECSDEKMISMRPISGLVTFPIEWQDTREKRELCTDSTP